MSGSKGVMSVNGANGVNTISGSTSGDDVIYSIGNDSINLGSGNDTVFVSGPSATIDPGVGNLLFVAGSGNYFLLSSSSTSNYVTSPQTIYGGSGNDNLSPTGRGSIVVAGSGNTTLSGGPQGLSTLFGGPGTDTLYSIGGDTLVGGTGKTSFTGGNVEFGASATSDTFEPLGGLVVEGNGSEQVDMGNFDEADTVFGGRGLDTYYLATSSSEPNPGATYIIGFKPGDIVAYNLETGNSLSTAIATEVKGSFGSTVNLNGASITFFGHTATAADFVHETRNLF